MVMYGTRDLDDGEQKLIDASDVAVFRAETIQEHGVTPVVEDVVSHLAKTSNHLYLHVDLDILDKSEISSLVLPVPDGLTLDEFRTSVQQMIRTGKACCLDVMVFDRTKDPEGEQAAKVVEWIAEILSA